MERIIVMGVAGSGKSVLSGNLGRRLGYAAFEGDDYHLPSSQEKMRAGIPLEDSDREPWLDCIGQVLAQYPGDIVLSCSALKRKYRERIRSHEPNLRFVYIEIDMQTAAQRVGSRTNHLFPKSLVASQFAALESPVGEHGVLTVSALLPTETQVEAVCRWLEATRAQPAATRSLN